MTALQLCTGWNLSMAYLLCSLTADIVENLSKIQLLPMKQSLLGCVWTLDFFSSCHLLLP